MAASPQAPLRPTVEQLLAGVARLAGHRSIVMRLNSLLEDESSGVAELTAVLRLDAGLCAQVVTAANTVLFRGGLPVSSVDEAVIRVGVWEVRRLLLGSIAFELTATGLRFYGLPPGEMWSRSLACALAMDALGQETRRSTDVCYTIGLLHAIGLIVVDRWASRPENLRVPPLGHAFASGLGERERALIGHSSAELGGHLLTSWKFPESIAQVVAHQETPLRAGRFRRLACLLVVARWVSETIMANYENSPMPDLPDEAVQAESGVSTDEAFRLIDPVRTRFEEYRSAVGTA
jgi:HD-like signal output (HDOD) protein